MRYTHMAKIEKNKHHKNELTTLLNFPLKASVPAERRQPVRYRICYGVSAMVIFFFLYGCINLGPDYAQPGLGIQPPNHMSMRPLKPSCWWPGIAGGRSSEIRSSTCWLTRSLKITGTSNKQPRVFWKCVINMSK